MTKKTRASSGACNVTDYTYRKNEVIQLNKFLIEICFQPNVVYSRHSELPGRRK